MGSYPLDGQVDYVERVPRWRPLINWLLYVPLYVWSRVLTYGAYVLAVLGWFVILFTGRLPGRFGDYLVGALRYRWRAYSYLFGLTDQYPGFRVVAGYVDPGDYPAVLYCVRPQRRRRLTVAFRLLLVIPQGFVLSFVSLAAFVVLVWGWFVCLITGRWPEDSRSFVIGWMRWSFRVSGYTQLLVDDYPPFGYESSQFPESVLFPEGETDGYVAPRLLRWPVVIGVVLYALNVYSSHRLSFPVSVSSSSSTTSPTEPAPYLFTPSLGSKMVAAPSGFAVQQDPGSYHGPISASGFDSYVGTAGTAARLSYVNGYGEDYGSNTDSDSIEVVLFQFASPVDAGSFVADIPPAPGVTVRRDPAMSQGWTYDSAAPDDTGAYHHGVVAIAGDTAMVIDYANGSATRPSLTDTLAEQQVGRL
jgi:hypothetical protein